MGSQGDIARVLCRYFMNGVCREGDNCRFSHNFSDRPDNVCRFYLQGQCSYGAKCRYDHVRPKQNKQSGSSGRRVNAPQTVTPTRTPSMVKLVKTPSEFKRPLSERMPSDWVNAPAFVPVSSAESSASSEPTSSYSEILRDGLIYEEDFSDSFDCLDDGSAAMLLCPFAEKSHCPFDNNCPYLHGDVCELCNCQALHPSDAVQRKAHIDECTRRIETDMEVAFACQRSEGVACGICLEVVVDRPNPADRYFGILSDCTHPFCLSCIRKWRQTSSEKLVRACPLCRTPSYFVTPSGIWVEDPEEKARLIGTYKAVLSTKPCKYFDQGRGTCPFGNGCFYRHADPQGVVVKQEVQLRHCSNADGDVKVVRSANLWSFMEARDTV